MDVDIELTTSLASMIILHNTYNDMYEIQSHDPRTPESYRVIINRKQHAKLIRAMVNCRSTNVLNIQVEPPRVEK